MKPRTLIGCLMPAMLGAGLMPSSVQASVIYREIFGTTVTDPGAIQESITVAGWSGIRGDGATSSPSLIASTGKPTDLGSVNANTAPDHEVLDRGFVNARYTNGYTYLFWTGEVSVSREALDANDVTFSWYQGTDAATLSTRLAIKIGEQWYASTKTFLNPTDPVTSPDSHFNARAREHSISLDDVDGFHELAVVTGSGGSITMASEASSLPASGDLVAFGLWTSMMGGAGDTGGRLTFDTFTVTVVPEPTAVGLLSLAGVLGLRRRRGGAL